VTPALLEMPLVRVACLLHHADGLTDVRNISVPLAETGQLTYVGLSGHVSNFVQRELQTWAKFDRQPMWNNVDVVTIIPVSSFSRGVSIVNTHGFCVWPRLHRGSLTRLSFPASPQIGASSDLDATDGLSKAILTWKDEVTTSCLRTCWPISKASNAGSYTCAVTS
jgi:hypothetical protein